MNAYSLTRRGIQRSRLYSENDDLVGSIRERHVAPFLTGVVSDASIDGPVERGIPGDLIGISTVSHLARSFLAVPLVPSQEQKTANLIHSGVVPFRGGPLTMGQVNSTPTNPLPTILLLQATGIDPEAQAEQSFQSSLGVAQLDAPLRCDLSQIELDAFHAPVGLEALDASARFVLERAGYTEARTPSSIGYEIRLDLVDLDMLRESTMLCLLENLHVRMRRRPAPSRAYLVRTLQSIREHFSVFITVSTYLQRAAAQQLAPRAASNSPPVEAPAVFPPTPTSRVDCERVVNSTCAALSSTELHEEGCAVCATLTLTKDMKPLSALTAVEMELLIQRPAVSLDCTRVERSHASQPIRGIEGPVLLHGCTGICQVCLTALKAKKTPQHALANGRWLGAVPPQLQKLTVLEECLVARIHRNIHVVRATQSNRNKLVGSVVSYPSPTPRVYEVLPPPRKDVEEMLAYIFMGPRPPERDIVFKLPYFVRRNAVKEALEWLKLNHCDYADIEISEERLAQYSADPEGEIPVKILYRKQNLDHTRDAESTAVHDHDPDGNTSETGACIYSVSALVQDGEGADLDEPARIARAVQDLRDGQPVLGVGRGTLPARFFDEPQFYPSMFPCLFPYGYGGVQNVRGRGAGARVSADRWLARLMLYSDKRFQRHEQFILTAFSNQQMLQSSRAAYVHTKRKDFPEVVRLLNGLEVDAVSEVINSLDSGSRPDVGRPEIRDVVKTLSKIELVTKSVHGSVSSRRAMKKELWSLISQRGAPTWFITISPPEHKSAICLYLADTRDNIRVGFLPPDIRDIISRNSAAAARYFDFIVNLFLKYALGEAFEDRKGLFGPFDAYYGTVEQQARLTLHLHLLLWIKNAPTPAMIRERLKRREADFTKELIDYLKASHRGDFQPVPGTSEVFAEETEVKQYLESIPEPIPTSCSVGCGTCHACLANERWWTELPEKTNEAVKLLNLHKHAAYSCRKTEGTTCKGRFPRDTVETDHVDDDGHVHLEKHEPMLNSFNDILTYLFRCNTDVTSLLSGTAVNSITAYITDYISKSALRSATMYDVIRRVLQRFETEGQGDSLPAEENARKLLNKMVNKLTSYQEVGSPMAAMYLLGNSDHYTNFKFVKFHWKPFVNYVYSARPLTEGASLPTDDDAVEIIRANDSYAPYEAVEDYVYRPSCFDDMPLLDFHLIWRKASKAKANVHAQDGSDGEAESDAGEPAIDSHRMFNLGLNPTSVAARIALTFQEGHGKRNNMCLKRRWAAADVQVAADFLTPLPRKDGQDTAYYAATMLALGIPWRSVTDLVDGNEKWEDALERRRLQFKGRGEALLRNSNVLHECRDARDDYARQRREQQRQLAEATNRYENDHPFRTEDTEFDADSVEAGVDHLASLEYRDIQSNRNLVEEMVFMAHATKAGLLNPLPHEDGLTNTSPNVSLPSLPVGRYTSMLEEEVDKRRMAESQTGMTNDPPDGSAMDVDTPDDVRNLHYTSSPANQRAIAETIRLRLQLNDEQSRAYTEVVEQAIDPKPKPLRMLIHGQGGTGKSQVLKAIIEFFEETGRGDTIAILAPTGTAAALISGQTYHSFLALAKSDDGTVFRITSNRRRESDIRIQRVKFIFIDEVSMIGCVELFNICKILAEASGEPTDEPFGGKNMIFAGDFAQLAPVKGTSLLSPPASFLKKSASREKALLGRLVWNQTTTVVSLTQNMRQTAEGEDEAKYRRMLDNLRFCDLDFQDIQFLQTLVADVGSGGKQLQTHASRTSAVITSTNVVREAINASCASLYAEESNQTLSIFYAHDRGNLPGRGRPRGSSEVATGIAITPAEQKIIDKLPPSCSEKIPGYLPLAIGIPVIIKHNVATSLGITNGAEGTVAGWEIDESVSTPGRPVLKVIFVRLTRPVRPVQLEGFPVNVVPLIRKQYSLTIRHRCGLQRKIKRSQVPIDLNFAMTDFASQGKTRAINVVNLDGMRDHHAIYTALSRGRTAEGTVILKMLRNVEKLTGGMKHSAYLRGFQEIELMNHISKLRIENRLPPSCKGETWQTLIRTYVASEGPPELDMCKALHWNSLGTDGPWTATTWEQQRSTLHGFDWKSKGRSNTKRRRPEDADDGENENAHERTRTRT